MSKNKKSKKVSRATTTVVLKTMSLATTKMGAAKTPTSSKPAAKKTAQKTAAKPATKKAASKTTAKKTAASKGTAKRASAKKSGKGPHTKTLRANSSTSTKNQSGKLPKAAPSSSKRAARHAPVPAAETKPAPTQATSERATRKSIYAQQVTDLRAALDTLKRLPPDDEQLQLFRAFALDILRVNGVVQLEADVMPADGAGNQLLEASSLDELGARMAVLNASDPQDVGWFVHATDNELKALRKFTKAVRPEALRVREVCKEIAVARNALNFAVSRQLNDHVRGTVETPRDRELLSNKTTATVSSYKNKLARLIPNTRGTPFTQSDIGYVIRNIDTRVSK